jgi:ABC-type glycerol-3-phosphate transport system permease component
VIWITLVAVNLICVLLAYSFLAYALAQLHWRGRGVAFVLLAIIISSQVWIVPQLIRTYVFGINAVLNWIWFADWLATAFSIVLLWHVLSNISADRADAARMDGCGGFGVYWHIVLPLVWPTLLLITLALLVAPAAELFMRGEPVALDQMSLLAISGTMIVPLIAIFLIARKLFPPAKSAEQL